MLLDKARSEPLFLDRLNSTGNEAFLKSRIAVELRLGLPCSTSIGVSYFAGASFSASSPGSTSSTCCLSRVTSEAWDTPFELASPAQGSQTKSGQARPRWIRLSVASGSSMTWEGVGTS